MKRILRVLAVVALVVCGVAAEGAPDVVFSFGDLAGTTVTNRKVVVRPANPTVWERLVGADTVATNTGVSGSFAISNMVPNDYTLELQGPPVTSRWVFTVPNTNGTLRVWDLVGVNTNNVAGLAYTKGQADTRFWEEDELVAGSNVTFRVSGGVTYIDTTGGQIFDESVSTNKLDAAAYAWLSMINGGRIQAGTISTNKVDSTFFAFLNRAPLFESGSESDASWYRIGNADNDETRFGYDFGTNAWFFNGNMAVLGRVTLGGPGGEGVSTNTTVIDGDLRLHVSQVNRRKISAGPADSPDQEGHIDFAMGTDAVMRINSGDNNSLEFISEGEIAAYPSGQPFRVYGDLAVTGAITGTIQGSQIFNESIPTNKLDATVYALLIAAQRAITNWHAPLINLTNVGSMSLTNLEFRGPNGIRFTDTNGAIVLDIPRDGSAVIVSNLIAYLRLQIGPTNATSGTNWLNFVTQFGVGRTNTISDGGSVINGVGMANGQIVASAGGTFPVLTNNAILNAGGKYLTNNANGFAIGREPVANHSLTTAGPILAYSYNTSSAGDSGFYRTRIRGHAIYTLGDPILYVTPATGQTVPTLKVGATNSLAALQIDPHGVATFGTNTTFNQHITIRTNLAEPTAVAGAAQLYALDVSGQSEMFAQGSDGLETQISSHPKDAPPALYDVEPFDLTPYMVRDANPYITNGAIRFVNVTRMARQTELMNRAILYLLGTRNLSTSNAVTKLLAQTPAERQVLTRESYAEYNARTGAKLTPKVWEVEQSKLQAEYDASRAAAIATNAIYVAEGNTNLVTVPPAVDVRRAKPGWMTR